MTVDKTNTDYISTIAATLYDCVTDGPIDGHHASLTWLDQSGERLTMVIRKADVES